LDNLAKKYDNIFQHSPGDSQAFVMKL